MRSVLRCGFLAALLVFGACKKKEAAPGGTVTAPEPVPPARVMKSIDLPKDLVVWGGVADPDEFLNKAATFASEVDSRASGLQLMAKAGLSTMPQTKAFFTSIDWSKPVRVALFEKEGALGPAAVLVGTAKGDAPKADNIKLLGGFLAMELESGLLEKHEGFLKRMGSLQQGRQLVFEFNIEGAVEKNKADIAAGIEMMLKGAGAAPVPGTDRLMKAMAKALNILVHDSGRFRMALDVRDDGLRLTMMHQAKEGTALSRFLQMSDPYPKEMLAEIPKSAVVAGAGQFWSKEILPLMEAFTMAYLPDDAKPDAIAAARSATTDLYAGLPRGAFSVHASTAGPGLTTAAIYEVEDADKARAGYRAWGKLAQASPLMQEAVNYKVEYEAYKVNGVSVDTMQTKIPVDETLMEAAPFMKPFMDVMQEMGTTHFAINKRRAFVVMGSDAKPEITAALEGKMKGGADALPGVKRAVKNALPGASWLMWMSPIDFARNAHLGGANPAKDVLKDVESGLGFSMSGGSRGGRMELRWDIPIETAKAMGGLAQVIQEQL